MGNRSRHKVSRLLPTRSRCLDLLYSLSLFTGSLKDFQRPYLHGVLHNNTRTGRSCWQGRNSLFSAEIPPNEVGKRHATRLANQPTSLELFSTPPAVARGGEAPGRTSHITHPSPLGAPSHQADVQIVEATASRSCTLPTRHHAQRTSVDVRRIRIVWTLYNVVSRPYFGLFNKTVIYETSPTQSVHVHRTRMSRRCLK
jgi:hypothetical protein